MNLEHIGWNNFFEKKYSELDNEHLFPARVCTEERGAYVIMSDAGEMPARVSGKIMHDTESKCDFPAVGDWVAAEMSPDGEQAVIRSLLPRNTCFMRQLAGNRTEAQVIAANIDTVFLVNALDGGRNFSLRRIERYLLLAKESGVTPVIVLNKIDLCEDYQSFLDEAASVAEGASVLAVSAKTGQGVQDLLEFAGEGVTVALLGVSGVGKSALTNAMTGKEDIEVGSVRADDRRGRHTTTRRQMVLLSSGGMLIDTPGMRELQLWSNEDTLDDTFSDITALADECQFKDCTHQGEPGCAIQVALFENLLDADRFASYLKLQKELSYLANRMEKKHQSNSKARWKDLSKYQKVRKKHIRDDLNSKY